MATDLANLIALRSNYIQMLLNETNFIVANGGMPKPSYSLDGESYSWAEYRTAMQAQIDSLTHMIQLEQTPFMTVSRGRAS